MGMQTPSIAQPQSQSSGKGGSMAPVGYSQETDSPFQGLQAPQQPVQDNQQSQGNQQPQGNQQSFGKGGSVTFPGQGGQPQMGKPNNYSNTVGPWDNANIQPRQTQSGKGKGY